jgi:hypothetical protein
VTVQKYSGFGSLKYCADAEVSVVANSAQFASISGSSVGSFRTWRWIVVLGWL